MNKELEIKTKKLGEKEIDLLFAQLKVLELKRSWIDLIE